MASINGDGYSGVSGVPVFRPDATDYRPKWGLYRGINSARFVGTNWVEDRSVTAGSYLPGDYNLNGTVDANDYALWRNTMGQTGAGLAADGNGNYRIDTGDYQVWRTYFGQKAASGTGSGEASKIQVTVPEPASLALAVWGLLTSGRMLYLRR